MTAACWQSLRIFQTKVQRSSPGFLFKTQVCYENVDCFSNHKPFDNSLEALPESPEEVDVTFTFFMRGGPANGVKFDYKDTNVNIIRTSGFTGNKPTKMIIHGYMSSAYEVWVHNMTNAFLSRGDFNVIAVDWKVGASKMYQQSVSNTRVVGALCAQLLARLRDTFNADMTKTHVTGHSLGAQTAGYIGNRIPGLGRITGLDPAGPLFEDYAPEVRLDPTDALYVDVIHTDAVPIHDAGFGMKSPCGHIDFYPNGLNEQPGCPPPVSTTLEQLLTMAFTNAFESVACSHERAEGLFTESLLQGPCKFTAHPCSSYDDYVAGRCPGCGSGPCPVMGYDSFLANRTGTFFLTTNGHSPYCREITAGFNNF
ncbi:Inactive pancreatic lipase-related protein 1 [Mizuhopecten yessoensis]|uniref:Inactive pancreatic lipase-related protein 1 n=1 Tax=Mizuhopecten yessoensis TaxID=6573 RepID=A0A210Q4H9_MIZYE|nr:Inactive pancreatic lipase-related protein 1 [Mizuhopecten yessoensis]